ncbi:hypothetical protein [Chitinophaga sp.]|uniref:hypothetical protein n=1 Tax=Chitinophaga sp. TaxID=1869181 RepID=UPI002F943BA2
MKIICHYYTSLHAFNVPFSLLLGCFGTLGSHKLDGFLLTFIISLLSGGFLLALFFYGLRYSNRYYFYYNKGFSKMKLIGLSYGMNVVVLMVYLLIKNSIA